MKLTVLKSIVGTFGLIITLAARAQVPPTPQNVQGAWIEAVTNCVGRLNWDLSPGASSYRVYRFDESNGVWEVLAPSILDNIFFEDGIGTQRVSYAVSAVGTEGESAASAAVTVAPATPSGGILHDPPGWDPGTLTATNAYTMWMSGLTSGADGMLEFGDSPTNLSLIGFNPSYQSGHGYWVSNLIPATVYYYRITSVGTNRAGMARLYSFMTLDTNHPPRADNVTVGQVLDYPTEVTLSCSDVDSPPSSSWTAFMFRVITMPTNGTLSATSLESWSPQAYLSYYPNPGARGEDHFQYVVSDGEMDSAPALVTITNIFLNRPPEPVSLVTNTPEDVPLALTLIATDPDGDPITFNMWGVSFGSISGTPPDLVYTPPPNFYGEDVIYYEATDGYYNGLASAQVTITVTPVNDPPVLEPFDFAFTTYEDWPVSVYFMASDVEGDPLTYRIVRGPTNGTLSGPMEALVYTPAPNYYGPDSFTCVAQDGQAESAEVLFNIMVEPVNDPPVATSFEVTVGEDSTISLLLSGSDVEGSPLTFHVQGGPYHGTLSGAPPELLYTPAPDYTGSDNFSYSVDDGQVEGLPADVSITVTPVNDAPMAQSFSVSTPYNTPCAVVLSGTDVEGSSLGFSVLTQPAGGTLSGVAPNLIFTPNIGFQGATSFSYVVNDGALDSAPAIVSIQVEPPTAVPAAPSGLIATAVSRSQISLSWNDNAVNEDGFRVEMANNGNGWTQIATLGPNTRTYASTGLAANKTYSYRVRAYNILGVSAYSNTASARTLK